MKKITAMLAALMCAIFAIGCATTDYSLKTEKPLPWSHESSTQTKYNVTETIEYSIDRYIGVEPHEKASNEALTSEKISTDDSRLILELTEGKITAALQKTAQAYADVVNKINSEKGTALTTTLNHNALIAAEKQYTALYMSFRMKFTNSENLTLPYRNQTENITSVAVFDKFSLQPVYSLKIASVIEAELDNLSYIVETDYTGATLGEEKSVYIDKNGNKKIYPLSISDPQFVDNDYLFYAVRAFTAVRNKGAAYFKVSNPIHDVLLDNKPTTHSMAAAYYDEKTDFIVNKDIYSLFCEIPAEKENDQTFALPVIPMSISLDTKKAGPPTTVYYSANPVRTVDGLIALTNVPVKIRRIEYDYVSLTRRFTQSYNMVSYRNVYEIAT